MSEAKFTKGEWLITDTCSNYVFDVVRIGNKDVNIGSEENARLIATAPDTYHAAIDAMSLLECLGLESSDEYQALKSATEKSRGEL